MVIQLVFPSFIPFTSIYFWYFFFLKNYVTYTPGTLSIKECSLKKPSALV